MAERSQEIPIDQIRAFQYDGTSLIPQLPATHVPQEENSVSVLPPNGQRRRSIRIVRTKEDE